MCYFKYMTKIPTQDTKVKELRINYPKVKVDAIEGRQCLPINEKNLNTSFHITYES